MNTDGPSGIQYRIGKSHLNSQLYRIKQEEKAEMRMHNNLKQRFMAKYSKRSIDQTVDAAQVKMFETHTPGFCYRRNGECRIPSVDSSTSSVDFENIHALLFTDEELDIEKVMCLHLLSAHKTETLKPPLKSDRALSFIAREQLPVERLIERSKKKFRDESLVKLLPRYVIDIKSGSSKEDSDIVIRDGRLAARVIINDKINQLVHTVLAALKNTNPDKMNKLLDLSKNTQKLADMFDKPNIQKFVTTLSDQLILYSCESFHLTPPFKAAVTTLKIDNKANGLAHLITHIRKNVLQLPIQATRKSKITAQDLLNNIDSKVIPREEEEIEKEKEKKIINVTASTTSKHKSAETPKRTKQNEPDKDRKPSNIPTANERFSKRNTINKKSEPKASRLPKYMDFLKESAPKKSSREIIESGSNRKEFDQSSSLSKSFVSESEAVGTLSDYSGYIDNLSSSNSIFKNVDLSTVAAVLSQKAEAAIKRDLEELESRSIHESTSRKFPMLHTNPAKVSIKQMNCIACLQKWKNPLPTPKAPKLRKLIVPVLDDANIAEFRTNSTHRLSILIDKEMKKINLEEKKRQSLEKQRASTTSYKNVKNNRNIMMQNNMDSVELDLLDLARISQEIKDKELKKRLKEFLNTKV